ncbi:MAG: hypothetical protein HYY14_03340, partial [Candidatus Omnitrophica bacterium]|nr:hypothetical protein [Candidatus Omnitrophota bacterium]
EFINFKFIPRVLFDKNVFLNIIAYIENFILEKNPVKASEFNIEEIKDYSIKRLCLDLNHIEEVREFVLHGTTYDFLVKENFLVDTFKKTGPNKRDYLSVKLKLKGKNELSRIVLGADRGKGLQELYKSKRFVKSILYEAAGVEIDVK